MPTEVQTNPRQVETSTGMPQEPQPASSEVSWMTLAMEKTKSLQQLFTSRFPRDFTAVQTTVRPQAQVQTMNQTDPHNRAQMQTQTLKVQPSSTPVQTAIHPDTAKAETVQSTSQTQSVKPSQMAPQQKTSTTPAGLSSREPQKQVDEPVSAAHSVSHSPVQTNSMATQSPLRSLIQTETSPHYVQGSATQPLAQSLLSSGQHDTLQQTPWNNQSFHRSNQLTSTTLVSTTSSATAASPVPNLEKGQTKANVQEKEGSSLPGRRPVWGASVSERAALMEKQAESANPQGTKGVCGTSL